MDGQGDIYLVGTYLLYGGISVALTVWLARMLFRNGAVFLEEAFEDRPGLAEAVNRLLVVGFYLLNLGYAFLILRAERAADAVSALETLLTKLGLLLVSLAVLHFANMYVIYRIRRRAEQGELPPPVAPQAMWSAPVQAPYAGPVPPQ
jgi:hypothetical protein